MMKSEGWERRERAEAVMPVQETYEDGLQWRQGGLVPCWVVGWSDDRLDRIIG